jgi:hypothetical protein
MPKTAPILPRPRTASRPTSASSGWRPLGALWPTSRIGWTAKFLPRRFRARLKAMRAHARTPERAIRQLRVMLSSSAKADDPVLRDAATRAEKPRRTGYPAFAGYDGWRRARRANHPVDYASESSNRPVALLKIFRFLLPPNQQYIPCRPASSRGAFRDRHERRARDAVDAAGAQRRSAL